MRYQCEPKRMATISGIGPRVQSALTAIMAFGYSSPRVGSSTSVFGVNAMPVTPAKCPEQVANAETEQQKKKPLTPNGKLARISLYCGIGAVAYPAAITGPIAALAAIVLGTLGIRSEKRGNAIAGIVLGGLAIGAFVLLTYLAIENRRVMNEVLRGFAP